LIFWCRSLSTQAFSANVGDAASVAVRGGSGGDEPHFWVCHTIYGRLAAATYKMW
jgi:hypothetical protein